MRSCASPNVSLRALAFLLVVAAASRHHRVLGFGGCLVAQQWQQRSFQRQQPLRAASDAPDDIVAAARKKAGAVQEEEVPSLFDDDLRVDLREALLKLDRRAREGPSALSPLEVEQLDGELGRIVAEMKVNQHKTKPRPPPSDAATVADDSTSQSQVSLLHADPDAIESLKERPASNLEDIDDHDETPVFEGKGGMGQPKGTVNTYIIPGMDDMSAEDYRDALQQSVIDRQARRRASGVVGGKSSTDYLDGLKPKD